MTRRFARRFQLAALGLVLVAVATLASSCGTDPVSLSLKPGSVNACYRGLPAARTALHENSAKLKGVHRVPVRRLKQMFPGIALPPGDNGGAECAFSFEGKFNPGQVTGAPPNNSGPYAIVVVSTKKLVLITSYVGDQLPRNFGERVALGG